MNTLPSSIVAPTAKVAATPATGKGSEAIASAAISAQPATAATGQPQASSDATLPTQAAAPFAAVLSASAMDASDSATGEVLTTIAADNGDTPVDPADLVDALVELSVSAGIQAAGPDQGRLNPTTEPAADASQPATGVHNAIQAAQLAGTASAAAAEAVPAAIGAGAVIAAAEPVNTRAASGTAATPAASTVVVAPQTATTSDAAVQITASTVVGAGTPDMAEPTVRNPNTTSIAHASLQQGAGTTSANGTTAASVSALPQGDNFVSQEVDAGRVRNADNSPQSSGTFNLLQTTAQSQAASRPVVLPQITMPQVPTQGFDQPLAARVSYMVDAGITNARIRLNPEHLGAIELNLTITGKAISAAFASSQADVRLAIEASIPKLREHFEASGMELADAQVGGDEAKSGKDHHQNLVAQVMDMAKASDQASKVNAAIDGRPHTSGRQDGDDSKPQGPAPLPQTASFEILI